MNSKPPTEKQMRAAATSGFMAYLKTAGRLKRQADGSLAKSAAGQPSEERVPVSHDEAVKLAGCMLKLNAAVMQQMEQVRPAVLTALGT